MFVGDQTKVGAVLRHLTKRAPVEIDYTSKSDEESFGATMQSATSECAEGEGVLRALLRVLKGS